MSTTPNTLDEVVEGWRRRSHCRREALDACAAAAPLPKTNVML
jgi:hypothetical protein